MLPHNGLPPYNSATAQVSPELSVRPRGVCEFDAATYLGISPSTLRKSRMNGRREGHMPAVPFVRAGRRVIYLISDLDHWLEVHKVQFDENHEA